MSFEKDTSQIADEEVFLTVSSSTVSLTTLRVVLRLPHPPIKTQLLVFKQRFPMFTCHPLSLLCEPRLCISFGFPFRLEANH